METKINVAEILKDKSQGTKLYDLLRNIDVELDKVHTTDVGTYIECTSTNEVGSTLLFDYSKLGTEKCWLEGLRILLPSKNMRDWGKFAWKKGDVLINSCGFQCIFKEWASDDYTKFNGCYSNSRDGYEDVSNAETAKFDKLDNNIAYGYVREIERKLGGILNLTTLEIEKQQVVELKSKVEIKPFDKVLVRNDKEDQWSANIFSYQVRDMYHCLGESYWRYCIPYIGNESLLGTTKDVEG